MDSVSVEGFKDGGYRAGWIYRVLNGGLDSKWKDAAFLPWVTRGTSHDTGDDRVPGMKS